MSAGISLIGMFVLFVIVVAPLVIGIVLIANSRRGGLGYPACGACQYNLSATVGTADRCPECGSPFTQVGILAPNGKRRPMLLWIGVAILLIPLMVLGLSFGALAFRSAAARTAQKQAIVAQQQALTAQQQAATDQTTATANDDAGEPIPADESE